LLTGELAGDVVGGKCCGICAMSSKLLSFRHNTGYQQFLYHFHFSTIGAHFSSDASQLPRNPVSQCNVVAFRSTLQRHWLRPAEVRG
jgi:hypothetical protein